MSSARKPKVVPKAIKPVKKNTDSQSVGAWEIVSTAIREIYKKNASKLRFEEIYRNAYNMVLQKHGDKLYNGVQAVIQDHLEGVTNNTIVPAFPMRPNVGREGGVEGVPSVASQTVAALSGQQYLRELKAAWEDHTTCMLMIRDVLLYVDRVYVKPANKLPIYELGLKLFRDSVFFSPSHPVQDRTIETLLDQVRLERDGEIIDRHALKGVIDMLLTLEHSKAANNNNSQAAGSMVKTLYETFFEPPFLDASREFYTIESADLLSRSDATQYLIYAERRLDEEELRVNNYLNATTMKKLRPSIEEVLLAHHVKTICEMENSGLVPMLVNEKLEDLVRMYKLLGRVDKGHEEMRAVISRYIKEVGKGINEQLGGISASGEPGMKRGSGSNSDLPSGENEKENEAPAGAAANPLRWVEALLEVRDKFDKLVEKAFLKDKAFTNEVNAAFEHVVNNNAKASEFVSLFIDENLKKGLKGKSEMEVDAILDKTITLFRLLGEKDVFERYYKQHLARRLLTGRSVSEDAEKNMIGKLKIECGYQFTAKLEGMFIDMKLSTDLMRDFRAKLDAAPAEAGGAGAIPPEITVNVLTATNWPVSATYAHTPHPVNLPFHIQKAADRFQNFYLSRFSGRKLSYLHHMGSADLRATFDKGRKELNVSTLAMVVLVGVFNEGPAANGSWVDFQKILEITGIPAPELRRTLQSLSVAKYKVLLKNSKGKDVGDNDGFKVNTAFTSPLNKIKILTIVGGGAGAMESEQERTDTMGKVDEDRRHEIEASIVRIMKSRKRMDHNQLVNEVVGQLSARFNPSPVMIKKRIEALIEREYLKRDDADRKYYDYVA
ncbi:hypothetical protein HDU96_007554 [Phlyctochytrium bullatum]|nr:hypothetical protein HDU96_007554 [Phlyctochytrium bullatum]